MENIQVGAYGWNNDSWQGSFYPEDLPSEWQFDYYNNMYRTVLVPQPEWLQCSEESLEEVLEAVEEPFSFYLEVSASSVEDEQQLVLTCEKLTSIIEVLDGLFAGIVLFDDDQNGMDEKQIKLMPVIEKLQKYKLTLVSASQSLEGWCWDYSGIKCSGNPCGVVSQLTSDAKQQAALMQDFEASLPENAKAAAFLVRDNQLVMQHLNNLKVVTELLGY